MTLRPWHLLLVAAALLVPLQAAAGGGGSGLSVSATLDYCGVNPGGVSCKIDASWSGVADAERYTATVTLADGSVTDMGTVGTGSGGGATSVWVPYAGNGVYTLTITAWGTDPEGKPKKVDEQDAGAKLAPKEKDKIQALPDEGKEKAPTGDGQKPPAGAEPDQPVPPEPEPSAPEPEPAPEPAPAPTPGADPAPEQPGAGEAPTPGPAAITGAAESAVTGAPEAG